MQTFTPRWVFFDIDDTLWNFSTNSLITLSILYKNSNLLKSQFSTENLFIDKYHVANAEMWKLYGAGEISTDHLQLHRFLDILDINVLEQNLKCRKPELCLTDENYNSIKNYAENSAKRLNRDYLDILCNQTLLIDGAIEMLAEVQKKFLTAALTNGFLSTQYKKLYNTPLWKYIRRMVVSEETEWRKPQMEMFEYARNCVGAKPQECVMIGDNAATDVQAARSAGWLALHFDPSGNGDISHLSQIPDLLSSI